MRMHPEKGKYMMEALEKSNNLTSKITKAKITNL